MNKLKANDGIEKEIKSIEASQDKGRIIDFIQSAARCIDDPNYVLKICAAFCSHDDKDIRKAVLFVLSIISSNFYKDKIDIILVGRILKYAFEFGDKEAIDTFEDVCFELSIDEKLWLRDQLKAFYQTYNLASYDCIQNKGDNTYI